MEVNSRGAMAPMVIVIVKMIVETAMASHPAVMRWEGGGVGGRSDKMVILAGNDDKPISLG